MMPNNIHDHTCHCFKPLRYNKEMNLARPTNCEGSAHLGVASKHFSERFLKIELSKPLNPC
ncbi:unnamed protein product [Moneuplotes crassus]|uniref:Uncharacterized protein n=1 Tax=Euplotes crassus TaxID=5936 RepID=A0AAD2D9P9_EUPCR|nr:unnamed protein product [Moneuplotes crassus]